MQHLDEGAIHAWLDGALTPAEAAQVAEHAAACTSCAAAVAEARGLIAASSRILEKLDDVPADVIPKVAASRMMTPLAAAASPRGVDAAAARAAVAATPTADITVAHPKRWWEKKTTLRIAAAIVVVATGGVVASHELDQRNMRANAIPGAASANARAESPSKEAAEALTMPNRSVDELDKKADRRAPASQRATAAKQAAPSTAEDRALADAASNKNEQMLKAKTGVAAPAPSPAAQPSSVAAAPPLPPAEPAAPTPARLEANAPATGAPRQLADSQVREPGQVIRRRVYDIGGGVLVTLDATPAAARADADTVREKAGAEQGVARGRAAAAASGLFQATPETHAISWQGADGTTYRLSGKLSTADLERVRRSLPTGQ